MSLAKILSFFPQITYKRYTEINSLCKHREVFAISPKDLVQIGWKPDLASTFVSWIQGMNLDEQLNQLAASGTQVISLDDPAYPPLLSQIYDPPLSLFVRGTLDPGTMSLGVVGTRNMSRYGKQITHDIVHDLATQKIPIVSGLAYGIDAEAHRATLDAHGTTIAVLGGGIDDETIAPAAHRGLAKEILQQGGAIISEYLPGTAPTTYSFPKRNRIIAGLCAGVLVIEAAEKSGALITAECALDAGREVFAVPQNITSPTSGGTFSLISRGATPIRSAEDILNVLDLPLRHMQQESVQLLPTSPIEALILNALSHEPKHIDHVARETRIHSGNLSSTLTMMEMKGLITHLGHMTYVKHHA